jgi:hypothetical protein
LGHTNPFIHPQLGPTRVCDNVPKKNNRRCQRWRKRGSGWRAWRGNRKSNPALEQCQIGSANRKVGLLPRSTSNESNFNQPRQNPSQICVRGFAIVPVQGEEGKSQILRRTALVRSTWRWRERGRGRGAYPFLFHSSTATKSSNLVQRHAGGRCKA